MTDHYDEQGRLRDPWAECADLQRRLADSQEIGRLTQKLAEQNCAKAQDLQRRLREAEAALAASYKSEGKWISLMGEAKAERGEMRLERDAARAAVHLLAGALERIEEWNPGGGVYCQGCYSETQRIAERALADPVVVAALEGKTDG